MSIINQIKLLHLLHLSKPPANRLVYQKIQRYQPRKLVELGISDVDRTLKMIGLASQLIPASEIHYVGMDPFEGRTDLDGPPICLKTIHQQLRPTGARIQLVPGNPLDSLIRLANSLGKVDLMILPRRFESEPFARLWYFIPRTLHEQTLVFIEDNDSDGQRTLRLKPRREIQQLASLGGIRRAA